MYYKTKVFVEQFPLVKRFFYHLIYSREISKVYNDLQMKSEFWTYTIDAHLLQATVYWCMVFGAEGCNSTHWKNLSEENKDELLQSFRKGLYEHTNLNSEQWQYYWKDMIDFRNQYAAHRELNFTKTVPDFTKALKVAYYYDDWIREVILLDVLEEPPLKDSSENMKKTIAPLIARFLQLTKDYKQNTEQEACKGGLWFFINLLFLSLPIIHLH